MSARLLLRWSLRDLRRRWPLVTAIALVIAIGTGLSAGLASMRSWRVASNDASFAALHVHDVEAALPAGADAPQGSLAAAVRSIPDARAVAAVDERLVVPTQVDASRPGHAVLVSGRIIGSPVGAPGPRVDGLAVAAGRGLHPADAGRPVALLEANFAGARGLPPAGTLRVAGGRRIRYVGTARTPELFYVLGSGGGLGGPGSFAGVMMPLASAQAVVGRPRRVNDAAVLLRPGADAAAVASQIRAAIARRLPGESATTSLRQDVDAYRLLYADADGDQQIMTVLSLLVLVGASLAAFNLISRVVEAQRREIGVAMALGAPMRLLVLRPLLMAAEIALLGAVLGVAVGVVVNAALRSVLADQLPLPILRTPFQPGLFAAGAAPGLALPIAAALAPVLRSARMRPIDAIRTGARARGGLHPLAGRLRIGRATARMPLRDVLRAPRRTLLTALGLAAVIAVVVAVLGLLDTFGGTIDRAASETAGATPGRLTVALDRFRATRSPAVRALESAPQVGASETDLALAGTLVAGRRSVDVALTLIDPRSALWRPTIAAGRWGPGSPGLVISREAASDLHVGVGHTLLLRHPVRTGASAFTIVERPVPVAAIHPSPLRFLAYMDRARAGAFGLADMTNSLAVIPAPGRSPADVERALFGRPGVASVEAVAAAMDATRHAVDRSAGVLRMTELFMLALAVLIGFNSTGISAEERAREHATMLAFGLPVRSVLRMAVVEGALVGLLGTAAGVAVGLALERWIAEVIWPRVVPDLGMEVTLSAASLGTAAVVGVVAMALSPLLTTGRLRRLDLPSTLRVIE